MLLFKSYLNGIQKDKDEMLRRIENWGNINSGSENLEGLDRMAKAAIKDFKVLGGELEVVNLPKRKRLDADGKIVEVESGKAVRVRKHPEAKFKVVLGGHLDTVYPTTSGFLRVEKVSKEKWRGPGITDMKGGIAVMLKALEVLEKSELAGRIGWEVILNPDEEIGSMASEFLYKAAAKGSNLGLVFEPSFPDGTLVSSRKGSLNYGVVVRGKAAHVGRDFYEGRNAVVGLARWVVAVNQLNDREKGLTVNVGKVQGGFAGNIVPDLAIGDVNVRVNSREEFEMMQEKFKEIRVEDDVKIELHKLAERTPKPFGDKEKQVFEALKETAKALGIELDWRPTGGVCDGNILAAAGVPTIDTLGVIGGNIHTEEEYLLVDSVVPRAQLTAAFLLNLAEAQHG